MSTVKDVYDCINEIAPFALAESWDNTGLLIGSPQGEVTRALVVLDITGSILEEAVSKGVNLIITHHPVIFSPLKSIREDSLVYRIIRSGISVISAHTNLDIAGGGVNDCLVSRLGLNEATGLAETGSEPFYKISVTVPVPDANKVYHAMADAGAGRTGKYSHCAFMLQGQGRYKPDKSANPYIGSPGQLEFVEETQIEMLVPPQRLDAVVTAMRRAHPYEEVAYDVVKNYGCVGRDYLGRIGKLAQAMYPEQLAVMVRQVLDAGGVRMVPGREPVGTVAVCGGSGGDFLHQARAMGAQALITGECKHHVLLEAAELGMTLIDAGHYATEAVVLEPLRHRLQEMLPGIKLRLSKKDKNPVKYI